MINIAKLACKAACSNLKELNLPYKLTLVLTNRCNYRCKTCNIWNSGNLPDSSIEDIEKFFKKAYFFSWVSLTGGEIFLRNDVYQICKIIADNAKDTCLITFPTNGFLTDKIMETVEKIIKLKFSKIVVSVSLDGPPLLHNELRGNPNAWNRALATFLELKKIKSRKVSVNFGYTISSYNMDSIEDTVKSIREVYPSLSLKDFHVNLAFNADRYSNLNDSGILCNDDEKLIRQLGLYEKNKPLTDPISFIDYLHVKLLKKYIKHKKIPLTCLSLASSCLVDVDWNMYPCFNFSKKISNLKEEDFDFKKIWAMRARKDIRSMIRNGNCPQCWTPCESFQSIMGNITKAVFC